MSSIKNPLGSFEGQLKFEVSQSRGDDLSLDEQLGRGAVLLGTVGQQPVE